MAHTRFEPSGWTGNEKMGYAKSIMDYIGRWLQFRFLEGEQLPLFTTSTPLEGMATTGTKSEAAIPPSQFGDAPLCPVCGSATRSSGTCFVCIMRLECWRVLIEVFRYKYLGTRRRLIIRLFFTLMPVSFLPTFNPT